MNAGVGKFFAVIIVLLVTLVAGVDRTDAGGNPLKGRWKVTTRLVAAQEAINPNYNVGDQRIERWKIRGSARKAVMKTPAGTIRGKKRGKAWEFKQNYDTGLGVILSMHIVARQLGDDKMRGTIKATYLSAQFGYPIGIDAWSFKGRK